MTFKQDIFISYAHIDNLALKEGEKGWIENFHHALEIRLAQLMGEKPGIWRDQKLQGNDFFGAEIVEQFPKTAVMISILSPRYLKSEWCTKEVREFYRKAAEGQGMKIGNKSRIFKVIKTAVPYDAHPREIADTLGYEFYVTDSLSGRVKELGQKSGGDLENLYWGKLDDIAQDLCSLLETLKQTGDTAVINHPEEQPAVFLAETCSDLKEQHDMIKRELIRFGYRVVPDCRLPFVVAEFDRAVENFLDQSVLSIHLVVGSGGMVPEGSRDSIVALQNELAAKKSKTGDLSRLVWLLPGSPSDDERHTRFVHRLRTDDESQAGADLFETSIEDFKSAIHQKLEEIKAAKTGKDDILQAVKGEYGYGYGCVYLAETNSNLQTYREKLKQELMKMGYHVFPVQPLPLVHEEFIKTVDNLLEQCGISIHILGEDYGVVPDKTDKSVVYLQYERSAEKTRKGRLKRLVRLPLTCDETDERMRVFIEKVKTEMKENTDPNDYFFETSLDDMGSLIFKKLREIEEEKRKNKEKDPGTAEPAGKGPSLVYLICDRMDVDHIPELEDLLFESGCEVMIPAFDGNEEELIADHRENLKSCDAVLIYYGEGNELWIRSITRDLTKIDGYGRTRPLSLRGVFLAPPAARPKERFRSQDTVIINGMQGFSPGLMQPFLEKLKSLGAMRS